MGTEFYIFLAVLGALLVGVIIIFPFRDLKRRRIKPDLKQNIGVPESQAGSDGRPSLLQKPGVWVRLETNATGEHGERLTKKQLDQLPGESRILQNLYVPKNNGFTTELDLVLVNEKGIYVIESKNLSGWIFGNDRQNEWTQVLKGGKKYRFPNPVWQNNGHINALKQYLGNVYGAKYYSYIVFSERCELKNLTVHAKNVTVLKRNELLDNICIDMNQRPKSLTLDQVNTIHNHLQKLSNATDQVKAQHIWDIKKRTNAQ